ncbi:hypothetical protein OPV22_027544 [Ensete ventricosum]|uniref:Uncharacterized protein n=1 Tax=Ensete ventricosum TaxID=4639 RepID=A0AAV8PVY2_ENSVE|nr:hypothetical protein OPV22_027544 [Ensete ventricosum]
MRRLEEKNTAKMGHTLLTDYYPTKLGEAVVPPAAAIPPLPPRNESSKTSNRWPVAFSQQLHMDHVDAWPSPTAMQFSSHGTSGLGVPRPPHGLLLDPCTQSWRVYSGHVLKLRA